MKTLRSLTWHDAGKWLVAALLLCGAAAVRGQEPIEVVGGDVKPVKIVKYIKTTVDGLLITKLPATLKVPGSGLEYKWTLPATIKSNVDRNTVEIIEAPNGELTASVTWKVVDFDAKKIVDHASTLTVMIGEVVPPKPPDPPAPDTPLIKSLRAAWAKESIADKAKLSLYIAANANAAAMANDSTVTTVKQVRDRFVADSVAPALPNVRAVVSAELDAKLPRTVNAVLDDDNRRTISSTFDAIAAGLRGLQ